MSEEMRMSDIENSIKASSVMDFVEMIRGAYSCGFIDNHPTNYDIYRSAQVHVKDRYGIETKSWDDDIAEMSKSDNHDSMLDRIAQLESERDLAQEQIKSLFERVSGVEVSEYTPESMDYLADMIEGQMDADNGCIDKLKKDKAELVGLLNNLVNPDNCKKDIIHIIGNAESLLERIK